MLFGLAMDYEVFLVSRMREELRPRRRPDEAVVTGFRHGARVVTAAALIMIVVFAGFILVDDADHQVDRLRARDRRRSSTPSSSG